MALVKVATNWINPKHIVSVSQHRTEPQPGEYFLRFVNGDHLKFFLGAEKFSTVEDFLLWLDDQSCPCCCEEEA